MDIKTLVDEIMEVQRAKCVASGLRDREPDPWV